MKNGYSIYWTPHALGELAETIEYLEQNFTVKELKKLAQSIENVTQLLSNNPRLFRLSEKEGVYQVPVLKFNTMYYQVKDNQIEIVSFFSNRKSPNKRKIKG